MTIRKIFFETICGVILVAMAAGGPIYAGQGDPVREGKEVTYGIDIGSGAYLDDANVTDGNIPYMQAAGAGFGDSPLNRTDASTVTLKAATGQPAVLALSADAAEDNSDKWRVSVADGGDVTLETYQSGAWVTAATWTNAGGYTITGALAATTLDTGQGAYELYAMNQDVETTDAVTFATVDTGQGANELYDMDQNVLTTSSPTFGGLVVTGGQSVKKTNISDANYGTSALTSDYIIAWGSLSASRTATISTEDVQSGTTTQPRVMIFKDESGNADDYPISIVLENGSTIDGQAAYSINQAYGSVTIYLNGTSGFCY